MVAEWGKITAAEILRPVRGRLVSGREGTAFTALCTDSRKARPGELFWALKGDQYDGHDFIEPAIRAGVSGVVASAKWFGESGSPVRRGNQETGPAMIAVDDTLSALGDVAGWWRRQYETVVLAVTGSAGKSTTKEMCAHILEREAVILKSRGNFNNLIGLPLTLLQLVPGVRKTIVELGMNRPGEIARLTAISNPDVGVITNVGKVHLEGLGSIEAVAKAKVELIQNMSPGGRVILNGDDPLLLSTARAVRKEIITFGLQPENDVRAEEIRSGGPGGGVSFKLLFEGISRSVHLKVPGVHNVRNALAAATAGLASGSHPDHVAAGLEDFQGIGSRLAMDSLPGGVTVIDDSYNASPLSLRAAFDFMQSAVRGRGRLVVALGDMRELGNASQSEHRTAGELVAGSGASYLIVMGDYARDVIEGAVEAGFPEEATALAADHEEMLLILHHIVRKGDVVFFKASRAVALEKVVGGFKADWSARGQSS